MKIHRKEEVYRCCSIFMMGLTWTQKLTEIGIDPLKECKIRVLDSTRHSQSIMENEKLAKLIMEFGAQKIDDPESRADYLNHLTHGEHGEDPATFMFFCSVINQSGLFLPNWDMMLGRFSEIILAEPGYQNMDWLRGFVEWRKFNAAMLLTTKYLNELKDESYMEGFLSGLQKTTEGNLRLINHFYNHCKDHLDFEPLFSTFRTLERMLENGGPHVHHSRHIESIVIQLMEAVDLLLVENEVDRLPHLLYFLSGLSEKSLHSLISQYSSMGVMGDEEFEATRYFFERQIKITSMGADLSAFASHESLEIDFLIAKTRTPTLYGSPYQVTDLFDIEEFVALLDEIHETILNSENFESPLFKSMLGHVRKNISWYQAFYDVFTEHPDWSMIEIQAQLRYTVELTGSIEAAMAWWPENEEQVQAKINAGFQALIEHKYEK